ncbi:hypothetical protein BH23GEM3_BH23GEM3_13820 [soil metagenome]
MLLLAIPVWAQSAAPVDAARLHATRESLQQLMLSYEQAAQSPSLSAEEQVRARAEAALIRSRLQEGDFQAGDEIALVLEGYADLSTTYTVDPNRSIALPMVGTIPLHGVLRSELQGHVEQNVGRYIRDPRLRTESTIRLMVLGGVGRPGYYAVPSNALVTDVITMAGGTTGGSRLTKIRIERDGDRLIGDRPLQDAIIAGRTLDQLSVRAGDQVIVPGPRGQNLRAALGWVGAAGSAIWAITRIARWAR